MGDGAHELLNIRSWVGCGVGGVDGSGVYCGIVLSGGGYLGGVDVYVYVRACVFRLCEVLLCAREFGQWKSDSGDALRQTV